MSRRQEATAVEADPLDADIGGHALEMVALPGHSAGAGMQQTVVFRRTVPGDEQQGPPAGAEAGVNPVHHDIQGRIDGHFLSVTERQKTAPFGCIEPR
jgi:hypothetical protein